MTCGSLLLLEHESNASSLFCSNWELSTRFQGHWTCGQWTGTPSSTLVELCGADIIAKYPKVVPTGDLRMIPSIAENPSASYQAEKLRSGLSGWTAYMLQDEHKVRITSMGVMQTIMGQDKGREERESSCVGDEARVAQCFRGELGARTEMGLFPHQKCFVDVCSDDFLLSVPRNKLLLACSNASAAARRGATTRGGCARSAGA